MCSESNERHNCQSISARVTYVCIPFLLCTHPLILPIHLFPSHSHSHSQDTLRQLKDLSTASPAVKLFAEWCEKAPKDPQWRGRFKVINSCTNLEELGMPKIIVDYNAKPVLIRRTGTIFSGQGYMEMNIHVHKFATMAKSSIHLISSRCGLMYMQVLRWVSRSMSDALLTALNAGKKYELSSYSFDLIIIDCYFENYCIMSQSSDVKIVAPF